MFLRKVGYNMGQFSWMDCKDRDKQILDDVNRTSYLLVPKMYGGGHIAEECYDGDGRFGGQDVYDLVADWNRSFCDKVADLCEAGKWVCDTNKEDIENLRRFYRGEDITCEKRWIGIILACYDDDNFSLPFPIKITYDESAVYERCLPSYSDPNQGWGYEEDYWDEEEEEDY